MWFAFGIRDGRLGDGKLARSLGFRFTRFFAEIFCQCGQIIFSKVPF